MNIDALLESLASVEQTVPSEIGILELRRSSIDDLQRRLRRFLKTGGECCEKDFDRGEWTNYDDRTLVRLPQGAHAVVYHASGGLKFSAGLAPMEHLFKEMESKAALTARVQEAAKTFGAGDSAARGDTLRARHEIIATKWLSSRAQRGTFEAAIKVPRCARDDSSVVTTGSIIL